MHQGECLEVLIIAMGSNAESELRQLYNLLKSPLCIGVGLQLIICLVHVYMYIHVATLRERACLSVVFSTQL